MFTITVSDSPEDPNGRWTVEVDDLSRKDEDPHRAQGASLRDLLIDCDMTILERSPKLEPPS